jgi:hypothetical protein
MLAFTDLETSVFPEATEHRVVKCLGNRLTGGGEVPAAL